MLPFESIEELLLDATFVDYCRNKDSVFRQKWEGLQSQFPHLQKHVVEARDILSLIDPQLPESEIELEVLKLKDTLDRLDAPGVETITETPRRRRMIGRILVLTIIVLLIGAGLFYYLSPNGHKPGVMAQVFTTGTGERRTLELPDGSMVILNSNSSITLSASFNQEERRLELVGEGFFKVAKDASRAFIVSSNHFSTTAIGTAFYIDARREKDNEYRVNLLEGKVRIQSPADESVLKAGEQGQWKPSGERFVRKNFDTTYLRQWLSGNISFQKMPAAKAFSLLEEWFAVKIVDQRKNKTEIVITGNYSNSPLEDVLKVICFSLSCDYSIEGDKVIIR